MTWRVPGLGAYWNEHKGEPNRLAFKTLVESGRAHGCLAFDGDTPVGWCSIGPRADFDYLRRSRSIPVSEQEGLWSLTCFYISKEYQRRGISGLLIEAACVHAYELGAQWLEAYPHKPREQSLVPVFAHTGLLSPFLHHGFEVTAEAGSRLVVLKKLLFRPL